MLAFLHQACLLRGGCLPRLVQRSGTQTSWPAEAQILALVLLLARASWGNRFVFVRVCFHMCGSEMIAASPHSGCWGKALVFSIHHTLRMKSAWWESCREAAVILKILIRLSPLEPCGPRVALKNTHKPLLVSLSIL